MSLAKPRLSLWQILNMNFGFFGIHTALWLGRGLRERGRGKK